MPENSPPGNGYCCSMRRKFLVGIVGEDTSLPLPTEAADFIDFDEPPENGQVTMRIRFCPFCGQKVIGPFRKMGTGELE